MLTTAASEADIDDVLIDRDDPYNIFYSSGTTGLPKGIVHTHYVRMMYCTFFASAWRMTPESVVCHAGSIIFNGAMLTLMPWMFLGCTYVLLDHFDPQLLIETIRRERVDAHLHGAVADCGTAAPDELRRGNVRFARMSRLGGCAAAQGAEGGVAAARCRIASMNSTG